MPAVAYTKNILQQFNTTNVLINQNISQATLPCSGIALREISPTTEKIFDIKRNLSVKEFDCFGIKEYKDARKNPRWL